MRVKIHQRQEVNSTTSTIIFKTLTQPKGIKKHYRDIHMIGKHFLICGEQNLNVKRHFTICNCMRKEVYNEYLRVLKEELDNEENIKFKEQLLNDTDSDEIVVTVKNYNIVGGLSRMVHLCHQDTVFHIKGPMGKGLGI